MNTKSGKYTAKPVKRVLDPHFRRHYKYYIFQPIIITIILISLLLAFDSVKQTVLIASLGASTFIAYSLPHKGSSRPRYLLGGYLIAILVGCLCSNLADSFSSSIFTNERIVDIVLAATATGVSAFLMVVTDTEHPPAASLALGFVLNQWDFVIIVMVISGILAISISKELVKRYLVDLL